MKLRDAALLREYMQLQGFSFADLASRVGCSKSFISHLTAGRKTSCKPRTAQRIAKALQAPVTALFLPKVPRTAQKNRRSKQREATA